MSSVDPVATAATGSGHDTNAFSTAAPAAIAAATTTPQAIHCRRARSWAVVAPLHRRT